MTTIHARYEYTAVVECSFALPEGKTESDVASIFMRYGDIHVIFKDNSQYIQKHKEELASTPPKFADGERYTADGGVLIYSNMDDGDDSDDE